MTSAVTALSDSARQLSLAAPGGVRTTIAFSQDKYFDNRPMTTPRTAAFVRSNTPTAQRAASRFSMATSPKTVVSSKTAGVDESIWKFEGPARVFDSQESACDAILSGQIKAGDIVLINYEGPKGGPGMQEMLYPTSYIKAKKLGAVCALITDGRFSGGPRDSRSDTFLRKRQRAARSGSSRKATRFESISPIEASNSASTTPSSPIGVAAMEERGAPAWMPEPQARSLDGICVPTE